MKKIVSSILVLLSVLMLVACGEKEVTKYTVSFDSAGGREVQSVVVEENGFATKPQDPIREGFIFQYWYQTNVSVEFIFATTPITGDLKLIAHWEASQTLTSYVVTFDSKGGSVVSNQTLAEGSKVTKPADPTRDDFEFKHWSLDDNDGAEYDFNTSVTNNVTLYAIWEALDVLSSEDKLALEIAAIEETIVVSKNELNLPNKGAYASAIAWWTNSPYISNSGVVLSLPEGVDEETGQIRGTFTIDGKKFEHFFTINLTSFDEVELTETKNLPFVNMTTEYDIANNDNVEVYYEENGSVPYIKVETFLNLISGFIDPIYELEFEYLEDGSLQISYDYYSEEEDHTYHLVNVLNPNDNTITTNDPGFYSAYVYSTATNYGRHIIYPKPLEGEELYEGESYLEGGDIVYDLGKYAIDIVTYNNEVVLPLSLVNQLYAGSSYYNVYYNHDRLIGIYSVPETSSDEYKAMKDSSVQGNAVPGDMISMTYNAFAFYLDHFYGLKDIMEIESYYPELFKYKNSLLNKNANTVDTAIFNFLTSDDFSEAHTSYRFSSFYNNGNGPSLSIASLRGRTRLFYDDGIWLVQDLIDGKWTSSLNRPNYWFLDDEKLGVVITLDDFFTSDIVEDDHYNVDAVNKILDDEILLPNVLGGSKYFYYDNSGLEDKQLELLVKGLNQEDVDTYITLLEADGFVKDGTTSFYKKTIGEIEYVVLVDYHVEYEFFYLGVNNTYGNRYNLGSLDTFMLSDSAVYLELVLDQVLKESPGVEDVILDITYNTGGNVGALYRVVGVITDDVYYVSGQNRLTGSAYTSAILIDGVTTAGHNLNWNLLASGASFSAANSLVSIFTYNELGMVIGATSGGGAASITPILLPNGTVITMSSNNLSSIRSGSGTDTDPYVYNDVEFGLAPDYVINSNDFYNEQVLYDIISQQAQNGE